MEVGPNMNVAYGAGVSIEASYMRDDASDGKLVKEYPA
jgi:hypothetical protein